MTSLTCMVPLCSAVSCSEAGVWEHHFKSSCFSPSCGRPWHQQCWLWPRVCINEVQSLLWYQVMLLLGFLLRGEEISMCSSATGTVVKKDEYSSASASFLAETTACLSLALKKIIYPLITEVEWELSRKQSSCPREMPRKVNTKTCVSSCHENNAVNFFR